ncbi:hypothetical protein RFN30_21520 [Mesorhizobium sp. VK23D]|nr:hypothetical protein [Mesorhizobium sp. VK23D]
MFTLQDVGTRCRLTCSYRNKVIEAEEDDYFEALCQIRKQLEVEGILPFCYGASYNIFPEGDFDRDESWIGGLQGENGGASQRERLSQYI